MSNKQIDWRLQGHYFETCNCEVACPCVWLQPPSEGECKLLVAWHIENGFLENVRLDGMNVALACYAMGTMINGNWSAALYLDSRADDKQTEALQSIFTGQAGGHLSVLIGFVGEVWGIHKVGIHYRQDGNSRSLSIPEIADAEIQSIRGISGGDAFIENPPLCVVTSHPSVVAKSTHFRYSDHGRDWQFSERNGYHSAFTYQP
ncbi:DUF1326 domain-containing protein [Methylomonas sp. MgM2]